MRSKFTVLGPGFSKKIRDFINTPFIGFSKCEWLTCKYMKVYMRRIPIPMRIDTSRDCIVVATVSVMHQGRGIYSCFLRFLEQEAQGRTLVIENVLDPKHYPIYLRRGFTQFSSDGCSTSFYKHTKDDHEILN